MTSRFSQFVSPHVHQQSFDSASTPEAFLKRELELGTGALVTTDHGSMGACRKVYDLAKANKLTPILGLEAYVRDDGCAILKRMGIEDPAKYNKYYHLTMHALDERAFEKISYKLSNARIEKHGSESKPLFSWADIEEIGAENVTMTSSCLIGMVQRHILAHSNLEVATAYYEKLRSVVKPGNFFVEVFPHKCDNNWVQGVFVDLADGQKLRFWDKKKLKFERFGETDAQTAAATFGTKKWDPEDKLVAVMTNRKWQDRAPLLVTSINQVEGFLQNDPCDWAPDSDVQKGCNRVVMALAKRYGDKILCSDDAHFATADEKIVQDIRLAQMGNWRFSASYHRQTSAEAYEKLNERLGIDEKTFEGWVENSREWADRFKGFAFTSKPSLPTKFYPEGTLAHTLQLIKKHGRMDWNNPKYLERLQAEINLVHYNGTLDLLPYFMMAEEIGSHYEDLGLLTGPGRGSAAGLLLTYLLGITHVDALKYDLSMDRFLTIDRVKSGTLPDIDSDYGTRDPLTDPENGWLKKRFGDHVAQVSNDITMKLKSSCKDVARVFHDGRVPEITENLVKRFQIPPQGISDADFVFGYEANGEMVTGSIETDEALKEYVRLFPKEWVIVQQCLGLPKSRGRHASAYVIANRPIAEFIPTELISGYTCTQFTANSVEASGGIKLDLLVVNSINDIQDCLKLVQERAGLPIPKHEVLNGRRVPAVRMLPHEGKLHDIWDLPEDLAVFRDVAEGKTETVFQFGTHGAVKWLTHFNHWKNQGEGRKAIDSIEAMSAFTALDRPGPLDAEVEAPDGTKHNMLVEFARRARGEAPVGEIPELTALLPETYGVLTYQEQIERMYKQLTGCSVAEAEEFRRNVAKKKMDKILKAYGPWMERVGARYGEETAKAIWAQTTTFGQYAFNRSHSVCYVIIGYACAFLKHHYPLEWWTSVLRNASKNEINETFWKFCGHLIDLPDVAISQQKFAIVNGRIRAPVSLLDGVGENAHNQLMAGAPYASVQDFCDKIEAYCVDNAKPVLNPDGTQKMKSVTKGRGTNKVTLTVPCVRRATSALNRGVCYKLIVSGALDSLFPATIDGQPTHELDKLSIFEEALGRSKGKKPEAVDEIYKNLNGMRRYQMRKAALPPYSESLLNLIAAANYPGVSLRESEDGVGAYYRLGNDTIPFLSPEEVDRLNHLSPYPDGLKIWAALPAYVTSQRIFSYGGGKEACEFELDFEGTRMKMVKWPDRNTGKLAPMFKAKLEGSICIAVVSRYKEDRPFGLEGLAVVQAPLGEDETDADLDD